MSTTYTDVDRMILDRWEEVSQLIEARGELEERIAAVVGAAGDRLERWLDPKGYDIEVDTKGAEFSVYRRTWQAKKKGAAVYFVLGGFCPRGYRRNDEPYPSLWLQTSSLENYRLKGADMRAFAAELRQELGPAFADWDHDHCDDLKWPLVQYMPKYDDRRRCELVSSSEDLYAFAVEVLPRAFEISDAVDRCVTKVLAR